MTTQSSQPRSQRDGDDLLIFVRAVPGASSDQIAGLVGDRLKVRVSAPPEGGKANKAICVLIAKSLGIKPRGVTIESGDTSSEKTIRIRSVDERIIARLAVRTPSPPAPLPGREGR